MLKEPLYSGNYPRSSTHLTRGPLRGLPSSAIFMQLWRIDPRALVLDCANW